MKKRMVSMMVLVAVLASNFAGLEIGAVGNEKGEEVSTATVDVPDYGDMEWRIIDGVLYVPEGIKAVLNGVISVEEYDSEIARMQAKGIAGNEIDFNCGDVEVKKVVLPATLEYIGDNAYQQWKYLEEIVIPSNVKEIGDAAFANCDNLKKVIVEDGVEKIGSCLFCGCNNLETVVMPKSVKEWDTSSAFMWCDSLKKVTLPEEGMDTMGTGMFYSCDALEELIIPDCVTTMNYGVTLGCKSLKVLRAGYHLVNFEAEEEPYPYSSVNFTLGCFGTGCSNMVLEAPLDSAIVEYARNYRYFTVKYDYPDFERMEWICDGKILDDGTVSPEIIFEYKAYPEETRIGGIQQKNLTKNVLQKDGYSCLRIGSTDINVDYERTDGRGIPAVHYFSETYTTQDENLEYTVEHTDYFRIIITKASLAEKRVQIEILKSGEWRSENAEWELLTPPIDTTVLTPTPTATLTKAVTLIPSVKVVKPAKTNIKSVKQSFVKKQGKKEYKKEIKISWKKAKNADGYVIYMKSGMGKYKAVKNITKGRTVSYTKKNLKKGRTYYFKMRAYRKVNRQKVYGNYSGVKKIKIK